jgi:hypothetical protein
MWKRDNVNYLTERGVTTPKMIFVPYTYASHVEYWYPLFVRFTIDYEQNGVYSAIERENVQNKKREKLIITKKKSESTAKKRKSKNPKINESLLEILIFDE